MCTSDALHGRVKQRKAKTAMKPTQVDRILITPLSRLKGSQTLVEGCGFNPPVADKTMGGMLSFTNSLAVRTMFNVLMFLEHGRQRGGAVRRSKGIIKTRISIKHLSDQHPSLSNIIEVHGTTTI